jgi:hypothetical protein
VSAANITKPIRLLLERVENPFTGEKYFQFHLRDKFHRSVGTGRGDTRELAKASGEELRAHLENAS